MKFFFDGADGVCVCYHIKKLYMQSRCDRLGIENIYWYRWIKKVKKKYLKSFRWNITMAVFVHMHTHTHCTVWHRYIGQLMAAVRYLKIWLDTKMKVIRIDKSENHIVLWMWMRVWLGYVCLCGTANAPCIHTQLCC